jgi:NTE family protein
VRGRLTPPVGARPDHPARIGIALAGGGFLGAAYELGALAALAESIDGLDLTGLDVYVGVSAGAFLAAGLANGLSPHAMVRMFVESERDDAPFDPATLLRPSWSAVSERLREAPRVAAEVLSELRRGWRQAGFGAAAWRGLDRATSLLPSGVLDAGPAEAKLARVFITRGRGNRFGDLPCVLRIVATDIDSGEAVAFGDARTAEVPISRAVVASSAVPGLFAPVHVGDRRFVDGALNKTLHASIALQEGARLVLCLNPLVPFQPTATGPSMTIAQGGLGAVLAQTVRTAIRSRMSVGLEKYRVSHPHADVLLFEPRPDDETMFATRIFSTSSRRELCEHAYRRTRMDLLERAPTLSPLLARHGLSLNLTRLNRPDLPLLRPTSGRHARPGTLASTTRRLTRTLDDLDRIVRLSHHR